MTTETGGKSLSELERETERRRADLVNTVDSLHSRISPEAVREGLRSYARESGRGLLHNLEERARENPLQTVAIAAGLAYPAWRLLMNIPAPILLVGAGLALSSSKRSAAHAQGSESVAATADAIGRAKTATAATVSDSIAGIKAVSERMTQAVDSTVQAGRAQVEAMGERAAAAASSATETAATVANKMGDAYRSGAESAAHVRNQISETATHGKQTLIQAIESHPLVIGAVGLAIGGVIASALPVTAAENQAFGGTSDELKHRASAMANEAGERMKSAAEDVYQSAAARLQENGLTPDGARAAVRDASDKIKETVQQAADATRLASERSS